MVLQAASRVARNYFDRGLILGPNAEPLAELRRKIRETGEIVTGLDEHPVWRNGKGEPIYTHYSDGVKALYLPFWFDTPAAAIDGYRELLRKHPGHLLDYFAARHWLQIYISENYGVPWLVGWNGEGNAELDKAWSAFMDSLEASGDVRDVLNGSLLKVADSKTRWGKEAASAGFCELIWKRRDEVFQTNYKAYFRCFPEIVVPDPLPYRVRWLGYYLQNAAAFDYDAVGYLWRPGDIESPAKAREILRQLQDFQNRLSTTGKLTNVARDRIAEFGAHLIEKFPEVAPAGKSPSEAVTVTHLWQPDATEGKLSHCFAWRDDKLWVAFSRELPAKNGEKPRYSVKICALNIPSFEVGQSIETPEDITLAGIFRGPDFYVTPTSVFLRERSQFHRYDRKQGTWTSFSFPDREYSPVFARGDELLAGFSEMGEAGESGILKWSAATGKVEVVASNRRRPGLHMFDDCPAYSVESICGGPDGKFGVKISKFYLHSPGSKEWEMPFPPATSAPSVIIPVGNFHLMISRKDGVLAIDNESGKMTPLPGSHFEAPPANPAPVYLPEAFLPDYARTGTAVNPAGTAYENGQLWTVRMRNDGVGQTLVLNRAERLDQPSSPGGNAGLVFKPPVDKAGHAGPASMNSIGARQIEMIATNQGLVMRIPGTEGFWFISNEDFDAALAASAKTPVPK